MWPRRHEAEVAVRREAAERLGERLPPLLVAAERVAATVAPGLHGRRRTGLGETFWQFRLYQPGDDVRTIDWRASARSDRHRFVRENEWEAAQSVWIWCDASASMDYRGPGQRESKRARAELLALALAVLLVRGGERVALMGAGHRPAGGRFGLERFAADLLQRPRTPESLPPELPLPRFARLVLISDFLGDLAALERRLAAQAAAGVAGAALVVFDPSEAELPFRGRMLFEDPEGGARVLLGRVEEVRADYRALFAGHLEELRARLGRCRTTLALHRTVQPPASGLLALVRMLDPQLGGRGG